MLPLPPNTLPSTLLSKSWSLTCRHDTESFWCGFIWRKLYCNRDLNVFKYKPKIVINSFFYAFFLVIPRRLEFICRRFGTFCSIYLPMKMEQTECFETSIYKLQKKAYNIQNTAKAWNQEIVSSLLKLEAWAHFPFGNFFKTGHMVELSRDARKQ